MKNITKLAILSAALVATGCSTNPKILGQKIDRDILCPSAGKFCAKTIGNQPPISITKEPRYLTASSTGLPDYWEILGREYFKDATKISNFCGNEAKNPLAAYADRTGVKLVDFIDNPKSNSVRFTRKVSAKSSFSTGADIDAIVNAAGIPTETARAEATAAVKAALEKVENSDLELKGEYSFVHLRESTLALLKANTVPNDLLACSNALKGDGEPLVSDITVVRIDTLTNSGTLAKSASASLNAALKGKIEDNELINLVSSFERKVDESYDVKFKPTYQILSIGGYKPKPKPE